jgi:hypothetical protein
MSLGIVGDILRVAGINFFGASNAPASRSLVLFRRKRTKGIPFDGCHQRHHLRRRVSSLQ